MVVVKRKARWVTRLVRQRCELGRSDGVGEEGAKLARSSSNRADKGWATVVPRKER